MELRDTFSNISGSVAKLPEVKRRLKLVEKKFRPQSPNDADDLTMLAVILWMVDDVKVALEILGFLDARVDTISGNADIVSSLATTRIFMAEIYNDIGQEGRVAQLMSSDGISSSYNFKTFENPVREIVKYRLDDLEFFENKSNSKPSELLQVFYHGLMDTTILIRRYVEVERVTNGSDREYLEEAHCQFKKGLKQYLLNGKRSK